MDGFAGRPVRTNLDRCALVWCISILFEPHAFRRFRLKTGQWGVSRLSFAVPRRILFDPQLATEFGSQVLRVLRAGKWVECK